MTRPDDGTGYLTAFRGTAPLIGQSAFCPGMSQLASSADSISLEVIGQNAAGTVAFLGAGGAFSDGVEVLDADNVLVHTFEQLQSMEGVRFSPDERFIVVIVNASGVGGDLQVLKIP